MSETPKRIQMSRQRPWRAENPDAVKVDRTTKWGNPFRYRERTGGLVRYQPATPDVIDYEGRISAHGTRHDYWDSDGSVTEFWVRWATRAEVVEFYRLTILAPTSGMISAYPSAGGHFLKVGLDDIRRELAGHDLACWCEPDQPCHADILLKLANA